MRKNDKIARKLEILKAIDDGFLPAAHQDGFPIPQIKVILDHDLWEEFQKASRGWKFKSFTVGISRVGSTGRRISIEM